VLLLYISADGLFPIRPQPEDMGYDLGGVLMAPKRDVEPQLPASQKTSGQVKEHCCLYPGDLFPYTRRPTLLIVDSDNSLAFCSMPHYFDMPCVVLCSPQNVPATFQGTDNAVILTEALIHQLLCNAQCACILFKGTRTRDF